MRVGTVAADFNLPGVDGQTVSLESLKDKSVVIVIFSCNHCPYVRAYEERMIKIQSDYADRSVSVVAINSNNDMTYKEDSFDNMKKRAAEMGFNFHYLRDETQEVARSYEAKYTPEVFLLDSERVIRYTGRIDDCWASAQHVKRHDLLEALEDVLHDREIAVKSTTPIGCTIKW